MLSSVTTWMNGEGIMLSEINQREKDKYHMISFIYKNLKKKTKKPPQPNSEKQIRFVATEAEAKTRGIG